MPDNALCTSEELSVAVEVVVAAVDAAFVKPLVKEDKSTLLTRLVIPLITVVELFVFGVFTLCKLA